MKSRFVFSCVLLGLLNMTQVARCETAREILAATGVQGGVVVHLGCGDGRLTAALHQGESYLVHGLGTDSAQVAEARRHIREAGVYGPVSVDQFDGRDLPYIDNSVNLLVADESADVPPDEIMRVLAPHGIAYVRKADGWTKTVKPRPEEMDDWTHYLYDATNNAVAHDTLVGPPRHLQWIVGPRYSRHHDHMSAASAMVSAGGRLFHIFDHASPFSIQLPSDWRLSARDAFNGTLLWQRAIPAWHTRMFRLKSGPAQLTRRLVAVDDVVYATLGLEAPVSALDAATGETIRTYEGTAKTEEIIYSDGVLFLLVNDQPYRQPRTPDSLNYDFVEGARRIVAVDAETGNLLWNQPHSSVLPITLTADARHVLFCGDERIVCLDRESGRQLWQSEPVQRRRSIPTFFGLTLVAYEDVVLFSGGSVERDPKNATGDDNTMYAFDAATGKLLWTAGHPASGYKSAEDILVLDGVAWITENTFGSQSGLVRGLDLRTGDVVKEFFPDVETHWFHHRCYRAKATDNYLLYSRTGIEFVDPDSEHWECHHWVRGACLYGVMPANGMVYNPPHPCACYLEAKLYGYNALAGKQSHRDAAASTELGERLERGPAYTVMADTQNLRPSSLPRRPSDWPTYRNDASRSGYTRESVSVTLEPAWRAEIGGRLSAVTVADGKLFVASIDEHTVHAVDAETGRPAWSYTAGGRVDSPPTIWRGNVLFGSADGYVYCLRSEDGQLIWRFRAAPLDRRMTAFEQLESVWPVHGSVLIRDAARTSTGKDELWCVAGRSMFLDGGLRLLRIDPASGELIDEKILDDRDPESDANLQVRLKTLNMPVALNDVLSADEDYVYMRSQRFDNRGERQEIEVPTLDVRAEGEGAHLFSPTGFLDDDWWHRSYWVFGRVWKSGAGGYYQAGRVNPAGRPMVFNESTVFGYGRTPQYYRWTTPLEYQLFASAKRPEMTGANRRGAADERRAKQGKKQPAAKKRRAGLSSKPTGQIQFGWTTEVPILVRAMVLADQTLFLAGAPQVIDETQTLDTFSAPETQEQLARQAAVLEGADGALLWAVSTDGQKLAEYQLDSIPAWDSMAAAAGRLYWSTADGAVVCFRP